MPKQREAATQLLRHRIKKGERMKLSTTIANSMYFQVIGNGTPGNPASLLLRSENRAYLFNCGEGTQRLAHERKIKFTCLENVFVTRSDWSRMGGLLGLTLTLQDIGIPRLTFHGPGRLDLLYRLTEPFVPISSEMRVATHRGDHVDPGLSVTYVPIRESNKCDNSKDNFDVVAYVGQAPQLPGSLDPKKCIELKIPVGPHLSQLKAGLDIDLPDGRHIQSSQVVGPSKIGPKFVVADCPNLSVMDLLITNPVLLNHAEDSNLKMVFHFTPSSIFEQQKYQEWIAKFPSNCQHFVFNETCNTLNFEAVYRMQTQLSMIDPHIFPSLSNVDKTTGETSQPTDGDTPDRIIRTESGDKIILRPTMSIEKSNLSNDVEAYRQEALEKEEFEDNLKELAPKLDQISSLNARPSSRYPELIFLGTGSAIPSKVRNTACILVNISPEVSIVMDAGEGAYGQLQRFYGEQIDEALKKIKLVYISHHHADHHLGLIELIRQRGRVTDDRLNVILPPFVRKWLIDYSSQFENLGPHLTYYDCSAFNPFQPATPDAESREETLRNAKHGQLEQNLIDKFPTIVNILTTRVRHCAHSYGIVITLNLPTSANADESEHYKIAYSGDAMPDDRFVLIARDCDLLIHEATMEDDLEAEALAKRHSTTSQAIEIGQRMCAKFVLLTHFSQRYAKIPMFNDKFNDNVGTAFDNLRLSCPADLSRLPLLKPALSALFREHIDALMMARQRFELRQRILSEASDKTQSSAV